MGSNIVIVKSKNDKYFFDAIIRRLNCNIEIAPPILIAEENYREMDGLDSVKLKKTLKDLQAEIQKGEIEKIGLIIDSDNVAKDDRVQFINECIQEVFPNSQSLHKTGEFINLGFEDFDIKFACYLTNVDGQGELETVLRQIKNNPSTYADCLSNWQSCINRQGQVISTKDFDKFWVSMYLKFDTCANSEKSQASRKCSMTGFNYVMRQKTNIWNLDHPILEELKDFFRLFC